MHKIFVYGTLREGEGNWAWALQGRSKKLGEETLPADYTMVSLGGFPAVSLDGSSPVVGEVYEVDDEVFQSIERLEGYPSLYDRVEVQTKYGAAWMYIMRELRANRDVIDDGDWIKYRWGNG